MEDVIARMQDEKNGIPIRTVKSFLSKIPSVFSGKNQSEFDIIWSSRSTLCKGILKQPVFNWVLCEMLWYSECYSQSPGVGETLTVLSVF